MQADSGDGVNEKEAFARVFFGLPSFPVLSLLYSLYYELLRVECVSFFVFVWNLREETCSKKEGSGKGERGQKGGGFKKGKGVGGLRLALFSLSFSKFMKGKKT